MALSGEGPPPFVPFSQGMQQAGENKGRTTENPKGNTLRIVCMLLSKKIFCRNFDPLKVEKLFSA